VSTDPVGDTIALITDTIFEWGPPDRRRLTNDYLVARDLAAAIYDAITEADDDAFADTQTEEN
jgi:hypothetical protein